MKGNKALLKMFSVAFFGHRYIENLCRLEQSLEKQIRNLLNEYEYIDFLVGNNGDFDQCVASSVRRVHKNYRDDNSSLVLVLPYDTAYYHNNKEYLEKYYSDIEIINEATHAHPKAAIQIRNKTMVDRSQLIICYIKRQEGGSWQTIKYAQAQGKQIINLAEND